MHHLKVMHFVNHDLMKLTLTHSHFSKLLIYVKHQKTYFIDYKLNIIEFICNLYYLSITFSIFIVKYTYFFLLHRIPLSIYYAHGKKENTTPELHDCRAPEYPRMRNSYYSRSTHVPLDQGDVYYWSVFCDRWWKAFLTRMVSLDIFSDHCRTRNDDSCEEGFLVCNTFCRTFCVFHRTHIIYRTFERWNNRAF